MLPISTVNNTTNGICTSGTSTLFWLQIIPSDCTPDCTGVPVAGWFVVVGVVESHGGLAPGWRGVVDVPG